MDKVAEDRQPLVVAKHGKPVVQVVPMPQEVELFGWMHGSGEILGDIISPLDVEWEAMK